MVKLKPTPSKRQSTKQRVKIKKRVAEHHRKARRAAKKNPQWTSRVKKDPGIPNSYPFKEQLLEEIRQKRSAEQEAKIAAKERAREERAARKASGADVEAESEEESDAESDGFADAAENLLLAAQTPMYRGSLEALLGENDVNTILVALDARDPLSWATPSLQAQAQAKGKHFAYVLARCDLVPREVVNAWTSVLKTRFGVPVFPVSLQAEPLGLAPVLEQVRAWGGAGAAVCGMENAGRTAVASALCGLARESEDAAPVTVYDTAHLISAEDPGKDDEAAMLRALVRNKGPMQRSKTIEPLGEALISRVARVLDIQLLYRLPAFAASAETRSGADLTPAEREEMCVHLARSMGHLSRRGKPTVTPIMRKLVFDWSHDKIMYYAKPPLSRSEAQAEAAQLGADLPTTRAGLDGVVLPLAAWRDAYSNRQIRLLPGPVDPRTLEWDYMFFVPPSERPPKEGREGKSVKFAVDGSEDEDEAELTEESASEDDDDEMDAGSAEEDEEEEMEVEKEAKQVPKSAVKSSKRKAEAAPKGQAKPQKKAAAQPEVKPGDKYNFFAHF